MMQEKVAARPATWITCAFSTCAAIALFGVTGSTLEISSFWPAVGIVVISLCIHVIYTWFRPDPLIGCVSGGVTALFWAGIMTGLASLAALRLNSPLIDADLALADEVLGVSTQAFVKWVAWHPTLVQLLNAAYLSTVPLIFATVLVLAWTRREASMWELCLAFAGAGILCTLISALVPAAGAFVHYETGSDLRAALPEGAGVYHLPTFYEYRSGTSNVVDIHHLNGLITFPSFHAAMALMTGYALRDLRWISGLAWAWSALTVLSAVPIGGHYAIDLLAGAAVWAPFALLARVKLPRGRRVILAPAATR